jgi:hypothetical protein
LLPEASAATKRSGTRSDATPVRLRRNGETSCKPCLQTNRGQANTCDLRVGGPVRSHDPAQAAMALARQHRAGRQSKGACSAAVALLARSLCWQPRCSLQLPGWLKALRRLAVFGRLRESTRGWRPQSFNRCWISPARMVQQALRAARRCLPRWRHLVPGRSPRLAVCVCCMGHVCPEGNVYETLQSNLPSTPHTQHIQTKNQTTIHIMTRTQTRYI